MTYFILSWVRIPPRRNAPPLGAVFPVPVYCTTVPTSCTLLRVSWLLSLMNIPLQTTTLGGSQSKLDSYYFNKVGGTSSY